MALGVIGLLAICALVYQAGLLFVRYLRAGQTLVPLLLLLQYFIAILFSGSLWGSASFLALMAVILCARPSPGRSQSERRLRARPPAALAPASGGIPR